MVLKNTKGTAPNFTASGFKNLALQLGIVKPLAESASTSENLHHISGKRSEMAVIHIMEKRGWVLEWQRIRTTIAEIDLIFTKRERVLLVEVKRIDNPWRTFERIQKGTLRLLEEWVNKVFKFADKNIPKQISTLWPL